ncbi:MutS-related protein [Paraclostridium bifermentans]|uniref:MutS-related protein n=1 Tax=Paraclostridium bifermentans TaxID=1490 RepID=UPI0011587696|nr:DNA mismatch repair protein MutS [Paraclostridium bifermentans]TQO59082.1 DNA mismatch repair protein MutS [Paraclostridium bifermentans]GKZ03346.1 DNA mismatch repair protein MutS [Paraclostridium bifermentans]GKZ06215.1 DNA mismatch repair protein MutS [Paraclostridium bifermentans]GKZ09405.1 DNA mismatch repair protein MutS [Paraclostridium bifermentans]
MGEVWKVLVGIIVIVVVGIVFSIVENRKRLEYIKLNIINNYGKTINLDEVMIKMKNVSSYFRNKNEKNIIDDITWNDLNMDDIFKKINNTQSTAGQEVLYDMLRTPVYSQAVLTKRDKVIEFFKKNEKERYDIQFILGKLGKSNELYITNCLFNKEDNSKSNLLKFTLLSWIPAISLLLLFIHPMFLILTVGCVVLNIFISQRNKVENYDANGFSYMISLVNAANKIKEKNIFEIDENIDSIDASLKKLKNIKRKSVGIQEKSIMSDMDVFAEYANLIFLREIITYEKVKNTIIKNKKELKNVYEYVGTIDSLIAIASFRESLDFYTKPCLKISEKREDNNIEFKDIYHPLVKEPVLNNGSFSKGVLITGSNASGKSTFIKTIAINAIMAQTIYTCFAKEYKTSYFNIYTSMALRDDIHSSESYYIVEIKSLKRILDQVQNNIPCLCFVDEILRGTNTVERIASSCEVLKNIGNENTLCFAATHDVELTYMLDDIFENYHFEETITDNDIKFDYKIHRGRAQTRNAIKLLEFMGYDKKLVENANYRAKNFLETGKWK